MSQPTSFTATDQPPPLDHRTVLVTGGSHDIGAATMRALQLLHGRCFGPLPQCRSQMWRQMPGNVNWLVRSQKSAQVKKRCSAVMWPSTCIWLDERRPHKSSSRSGAVAVAVASTWSQARVR
jgi:hypothetical protein